VLCHHYIITNITLSLEQSLAALETTNANLMRLSIVIRNSTNRDDFLKALGRYRFDPSSDISHVREKHWSGQKDSEFLIERLGRAITDRRAFLAYRESHQMKLSTPWEEEESFKQQDEATIAQTSHTKATTFVRGLDTLKRVDSDAISLGTQTSYEQTMIGMSQNRLQVPSPPVFAFDEIPFEYGKPFQCPLCFTEQVVGSKAHWK
jgi:hypothetical protein